MAVVVASLLLLIATTSRTVVATSSGAKVLPLTGSFRSPLLLQQASRVLEGGDNNDVDFDFVADYSIKFQGCHHVTQWNENMDNDNDVRIKTKRLVRFRLCESESCVSSKSSGCTSKYGDYVVDMNTFVSAYWQALQDDAEQICTNASNECQDECGGNNNDDSCIQACLEGYHLESCLDNDNDDGNNNNRIDPLDYAWCGQFDGIQGRRRHLEDANDNGYNDDDGNNNNGYYLGPYCAAQGGEIHLGLFTDDTCTTFASNGESLFSNAMGYSLPYSEDSLISQVCLQCSDSDNNGDNNNEENDNDRAAETNDLCGTVYEVSGKCETKMNVDYPNESACTYIEGIKIIREDGVIRTSQVKKSKAAAVCIGLFLTMAVLLAGYVMYLRTKLGRARVNLSAAAGTMA